MMFSRRPWSDDPFDAWDDEEIVLMKRGICFGKSGSGSTNTVVQNSAPPPQVMQNYTTAANMAQTAAAAPYMPYQGSMVAPFSDLQTTAFGNATAPTAASTPFYNAAGTAYGNAGGVYGAATGAYGLAGNAYGSAGSAYGSAGAALGNTTDIYNAATGMYGAEDAVLGNASGAYGAASGTYGAAGSELGGANNAYGAATGAYGAAGNAFSASTAPLWANTQQYSGNNLNQYISPYINDVVNSTANQFANTNAIQNAGVVGNAAAEGAWGGDRSAVAQAITAGQQQQAEAPVLAGLENTAFTTGQQEFNTQQAAQLGANEAQGWLASQAGSGEAAIGSGLANIGAGITNVAGQYGNIAAGEANIGAGLTNVASTYGNAGAGLAGIGAGETNVAGEYANIGAGLSGIGAGYSNVGSGLSGIGAGEANIGAGLTNTGAQAGNTALAQEQLLATLGGQEQSEMQAGLNIPYEQYAAGQAYPFETGQYYANIAEGTGSLSGGNSSTTSPGPSTFSQLAGLGIGGIGALGSTGAFGASGWLTGAGAASAGAAADAGFGAAGDFGLAALAARGGAIDPTKSSMPKAPSVGARPMEIGLRFIPHKLHMDTGGIVGFRPTEQQHFDTGGTPISTSAVSIPDVSISWVPQAQQGGIRGSGPPKAPNPSQQQQPTLGQDLSSLGTAVKGAGIFPLNKSSSSSTTPASAPAVNSIQQGPGVTVTTTGLDPNANASFSTDVAQDPSQVTPIAGMGPNDYRRGGGLHGYDDGGDVPTTDLPDVNVNTNAPSAGWQKVMPIIEHDESRGQNVMQHAYSGQGINPSTGTHTAPSTAQGYLQITNSTWRGEAPGAGVDTTQYPTAMSAPREIQEKVGEHLYDKYGVSPWAPYNPKLAADLGYSGGAGRGTQLAQADTGTMSDADQNMMPSGIVGSPQRSQSMIENAAQAPSGGSLHAMGVDPWLALMMAGFGMAAGNSPHALQNIGAGALEGAKSIQEQRLAGPKMALESAQAQEAQAHAHLANIQANLWDGALNPQQGTANPYQGTPNPTPAQVANALDTHVTNVQKVVSKNAPAVQGVPAPGAPTASAPPATTAAPEATAPTATHGALPGYAPPLPNAPALPSDTAPASSPPVQAAPSVAAQSSAAVPAPAAAPTQTPLTPEMQQLHQQYQAQIGAIDQQIAQVQRSLAQYQTPQMQRLALIDGTVAQSRNVLTQQLSGLQERRLGYVTSDPLAAVTRAQAEAAAKVPPAVAQKQQEGQIDLSFKGQEQQAQSDQERIDKELRPKADTANDTIATSNLIHDVANNGPATGWGADWKLDAGRVLKGLGATDDTVKSWLGTNVPAGQELQKLFLQQSAQAVRQMGAREPGSVISLFSHAYPNIETDPHAIQLMENVLAMQGKQSQDHYNLARTQHTQAISDLRSGKPYQPMDSLEEDFRGGAHSQENYLRAAQAMSGDIRAYAGLTPAQQRQIIGLIPSGHQVLMPNGSTAWRP